MPTGDLVAVRHSERTAELRYLGIVAVHLENLRQDHKKAAVGEGDEMAMEHVDSAISCLIGYCMAVTQRDPDAGLAMVADFSVGEYGSRRVLPRIVASMSEQLGIGEPKLGPDLKPLPSELRWP